jgi:dihydrofolate reductase
MKNQKKIVLYIAQSLDGFIARNDGDTGWLSMVEKSGEDYGYHDFVDSIDTVIMGRKTYDKVLSFGIGFPHKTKKCYVVSKTKTGRDDNVEFINGDMKSFVDSLKAVSEKTGETSPKNIYLDGGAMLVQEMIRLNLIDEMTISIIPVLLGDGISLFGKLREEIKLQLRSCKSFESGLVQLQYMI